MTNIAATTIETIKVQVTADTSSFMAAIEKAKAKTAELSEASKRIAKDMGQIGTSATKIDQLTDALDRVNARMETQRKKLADLKRAQETVFDDSKKSALEAKIAGIESSLAQLAKQSEKTASTLHGIESASGSMDALNKALQDVGVSSEQIGKINEELRKANPGVLRSQIEEVTAEMRKFGATDEQIAKVTTQIENGVPSAGRLSKEMKVLGEAYLNVAAAMAKVIVKAVETAATFDQSVANVKVATNASSKDLDRLREAAVKLGTETAFGATQTADAMGKMGQAGFSTNDIIAAMPGVLTLAAAGQVDLAKTVDITSGVLRGFGLQASESGRVADIFAKSAIDTNTNVTDLGAALQTVAPVASKMGVSIEEATAAIGELSNVGINGETAGNQLVTILTGLATPSKEAATMMQQLGLSLTDSTGKILPLSNIVGQLQTAFSGLSDAQKDQAAASLVGSGSVSSLLTLIQNGEGTLNTYTASLKNAGGTAEQMAGVQMDTLGGSIKELKAALESVGISAGESLIPAIKVITDLITGLLMNFNSLSPSVKTAIVTFGAAAAGVLGLAGAIGALSAAFVALDIAFPILGAIAVAVGAVSAGVAVLAGKHAAAKKEAKEFAEEQANLNNVLNQAPIERSTDDLKMIREKYEGLSEALKKKAEIESRLQQIGEAADNTDWRTSTDFGNILGEQLDLKKELKEVNGQIKDMGVSSDEAASKLLQLKNAMEDSTSALLQEHKATLETSIANNKRVDSLEEALLRYKQLSKLQDLDVQQQTELKRVSDILKSAYPELNGLRDKEGILRFANLSLAEDQIKSDREMVELSLKNERDFIDSLKRKTEAQKQSVATQIKYYDALLSKEKEVIAADAFTSQRTVDSIDQAQAEKLYAKNGKRNEARLNALSAEYNSLQAQSSELSNYGAGLKNGEETEFSSSNGEKDPPKGGPGGEPGDSPGKTPAELAADFRKKAYDTDLKNVQYQTELNDWSADQQIEAYEKIAKKHRQYLSENEEDERTMTLQLKRLHEDSEKSRYEFSAMWIEREQQQLEDAGKSEVERAQRELELWTKVRNDHSKDKKTDEYKAADEKVRESQKKLTSALEAEAKAQYDASEKWINAEVRRMQDSGASEADITQMKIDAWQHVRERYAQDSEYYADADEQLYQARKEMADKTAQLAEELVNKQKKEIEDAKQADLAAIEKRRKATLDSFDEQIAAIQRVRDANKQLNADADYETQLAEKNARIDLLASAVGPEGKAEREKLIAERDKMVLDHERELQDRSLEEQQDALKDQKDAQSDAFDLERDTVESQYDALLSVFETFGGDVKALESGIAAFRVSSSASANTQILSDLDAFVAQYTAKMASIAQLKAQQEQAADIAEYNANGAAWKAAKARNDTDEMQSLHEANEKLRAKYEMSKDVGYLQVFHGGGIVQGSGTDIPVITQPGEMVLTAQQQATLFDMLANPIRSLPLASPNGPVTTVTNHIDMSMHDVEIADPDTARSVYSERERAAARLQAAGVRL